MTGANSCLSILPSDVLMGRCEPGGLKGGGYLLREYARVFGAFSGVHTTLATGNWARPSPTVSASTVTSQSYSVNPIITVAFLSSVHCNPGYTALNHSPCMVQFLFVFFSFSLFCIVALSIVVLRMLVTCGQMLIVCFSSWEMSK